MNPSLLVIRIAINDHNHRVPTEDSTAPQTPLFPVDTYLLDEHQESAPDLDPQDSVNGGFKLQQCEQAYRHIWSPSWRLVAIAKIGCYVYSRGPEDESALWTIDEINELWPRKTPQAELWSWTEKVDMSFLGRA
jgi:hypothetical protein